MNLYLIERQDNIGYYEYDSWLVASCSAKLARLYGPDGKCDVDPETDPCIHADCVTLTLVGTTHRPEGQVIIASFNAG
jgi:hypothetical protein